MKKIKVFAIIMIMVMVLTGSTPSNVEAKTKASITVTNKSTGKKVGKKLTLKKGQKVQLKVKYGKKIVTKKAKYKTSDKNVATVTKKGKITAKSAGTCTVKVTYKKAVKKIKVTVKAEETTEVTTEATTEAEKPKKKKGYASDEEIAQAVEDLTVYSDPSPECFHEWKVERYASDIRITPEEFGKLYKDHLVLNIIRCTKCGDGAYTKPIPITEVNQKSDELAKVIIGYMNPHCKIYDDMPKHKCVEEYGWTAHNGCFMADNQCAICHRPYWD